MAPIPAGGSFTIHIAPRLTIGSHTVSVTVDTGEEIIELDEANNEKSADFSTVAPDLVVKSISWPAQASAGQDVTITVSVANQGTDKAVNSRLDLYINGERIGSIDIDELAVGASMNGEFSWSALAGPQEISAYADMDGLLLESNEGNNSRSRTISLEDPEAPVGEDEEEPDIDLSSDSSDDKGFISSYWWLLMIGAVVLGGGAFVLAFKSFKKD
jgi:subtilase family serine protease